MQNWTDVKAEQEKKNQIAKQNEPSCDEIEQMYNVFSRISWQEKEKFFKLYGLIQVASLSAETILEDEIDEEVFFQDMMNDSCYLPIEKEHIPRLLEQIEKNLNNHDYVVAIDYANIKKSRVISNDRIYEVIDRNNFDKFLVLANPDFKNAKERYLEKLKKGYDVSDLYSLDSTIAKALLPKMLHDFKEHTHGYPGDITEEEWDNILIELIWYFNELTYGTCENVFLEKHDNANFKDFSEKYQERFSHAQELLGKYFCALWD